MANLFDSVMFSMSSLKDFDSKELAYEVLSAIAEAGPQFFPTVYDIYEPLRHKCSRNDFDELVRVWVNEENAEAMAQNHYGMGQILMEHRRKPKISYQMYWEKCQHERFNYFILSADSEFLMIPKNLQNYLNLCKRLSILLEPVQGGIVNCSFPGWDIPIDLKIRHPELHWMAFFGKPYIELFGREKLLNAPCHQVIPIGEDTVALQLTDDLFQPIPHEARQRIKDYLGVDSFVEEGKYYRSYKTGIVPKFDFSNVLFDKNLCPVEIPIRMKGTKQ